MANVINPQSISFESILADLTAYVQSKPEYSRWKDFLEGSAGQIILELHAGLGVFKAFNELAKRLESYLDFARLQSSVYELAFGKGFLVPPAEAPELLLSVTPNFLITLNDGDLIGTLQDYSVYAIGGTQVLTAGVSQSVTCVVGNFEDRTLTLDTNAQFSTVEVNFATDTTPRKNLARQLEELKFGSQVLFLIDDITQISERGAFSGTTPIYVIRRALPSEAKLYIGNGTLGWFDETATSIEYKTLTFDDDIQSKLGNNVTLTIDAILNSQTILSRGSILLSTESVRGLAKFYPIDGRVVQDGDYEKIILKYYGSGGLDVVNDAYAVNTDPDEQVYLLTTSFFGTRDLDNITTLIDSRRAQGIQVFYHQVSESIPILHFTDGGGLVLAGTAPNGHILRSTDYGLTWVDLGQQFGEGVIRSLTYLDNRIVLAGTAPNGKILRSTDYGLTWVDLGQQFGEGVIYKLCYLENGIVIAGTDPNGKVLRSIDYGLTWTDLGQQFGETIVRIFVYLGNGVVLAGTLSHGHILRSINYGLTWTDLGQQFSQVGVHSISYLGNGIVVAGSSTGGKILRSTDYGLTWVDLGQQFGETTIVSLVDLGNGIVLAGTMPNGKILRSTDYGLTWVDLGQQLGETDLRSLTYLDNGVVVASTAPNGHILRSTDYGLTWVDLGQQFSQSYIYDISYPSGKVTRVTTSFAHGLSDGRIVFITDTPHYDGTYEIFNASANTFDIPINLEISILHFATNGGGGTTVTANVSHGLANGTTVQIIGTTHYNNSYIIFNVAGTIFDIPVVFVSDDATGVFIPDDATGNVNLGTIFTCKFNAPGITSDQISQAEAYLASLYKKFFRIPTTISTSDFAVKLSALLGIQVFPGTGPITHFADNGGGGARVTTTVTPPANGLKIVITGTTNYNGTYVVFNKADTTFDIAKVFSADDATGNWAYTDLILSATNFLKLVNVISWSN